MTVIDKASQEEQEHFGHTMCWSRFGVLLLSVVNVCSHPCGTGCCLNPVRIIYCAPHALTDSQAGSYSVSLPANSAGNRKCGMKGSSGKTNVGIHEMRVEEAGLDAEIPLKTLPCNSGGPSPILPSVEGKF